MTEWVRQLARERRDVLMAALHRIYEFAPPADRAVYLTARQVQGATDAGTLTDEEIDRFLPARSTESGEAHRRSHGPDITSAVGKPTG